MDTEVITYDANDPIAEPEAVYGDALYKKWHRTGFLTVDTWLDKGKMSIDIGTISNHGLESSTLVWVNAAELSTYLDAVYDGHAEVLYPTDEKRGAPTPECFAYYGGSHKDGKDISRIIKIHHWPKGETYDTTSFIWKCGHFEARRSEQGAFIPNMSKGLSQNSIKMTRREMAELRTKVNLCLIQFVVTNSGWVSSLNGKRK